MENNYAQLNRSMDAVSVRPLDSVVVPVHLLSLHDVADGAETSDWFVRMRKEAVELVCRVHALQHAAHCVWLK